MKNFLTKHYHAINIFALSVFVTLILTSFDSFALNTMTPETPLLKIGTLPLSRTEFISALFGITCIAGALLAFAVRTKGGNYSPVCATVIGAVSVFLAVFDVNMLQILVPDMRISHVIMTLSRVSAIAVGLCGIPAGFALATLDIRKHSVAAAAGVAAGAILAVTALSDSLYTVAFALTGIICLAAGIWGSFFKGADIPYIKPDLLPSLLSCTDSVISCTGLAFVILVSYNYLTVTVAASYTLYAVCALLTLICFIAAGKIKVPATAATAAVFTAVAIALCVTAVFVQTPFVTLLACCACGAMSGLSSSDRNTDVSVSGIAISASIFAGAVIACAAVHGMSEIVTYSGNRVVYVTGGEIFAIAAAFAAVKGIIYALTPVISGKILSRRSKSISCDGRSFTESALPGAEVPGTDSQACKQPQTSDKQS